MADRSNTIKPLPSPHDNWPHDAWPRDPKSNDLKQWNRCLNEANRPASGKAIVAPRKRHKTGTAGAKSAGSDNHPRQPARSKAKPAADHTKHPRAVHVPLPGRRPDFPPHPLPPVAGIPAPAQGHQGEQPPSPQPQVSPPEAVQLTPEGGGEAPDLKNVQPPPSRPWIGSPALATYSVTDYYVALPRARVDAVAASVGGLMGSRFGKRLGAPFGAAAGAFLAHALFPAWARFRQSEAVGEIRPGQRFDAQGNPAHYRAVAFGLGWNFGKGLSANKPLDVAVAGLATLMSQASDYGLPLPVVGSFFKPGFDWEFDMACDSSSLETGKCTAGVTLGAMGELPAGVTTRTMVSVQEPVQVSSKTVQDFLSGDFERRARAVAEIMTGNFLNQPILRALEAVKVEFGLSPHTIADLVPPGGFIWERFRTERQWKVPDDKSKVSLGGGLWVMAGRITKDNGDRYLFIRPLPTVQLAVGPASYTYRSGQQIMAKLPSDGSSAGLAAFTSELRAQLKQPLDSFAKDLGPEAPRLLSGIILDAVSGAGGPGGAQLPPDTIEAIRRAFDRL